VVGQSSPWSYWPKWIALTILVFFRLAIATRRRGRRARPVEEGQRLRRIRAASLDHHSAGNVRPARPLLTASNMRSGASRLRAPMASAGEQSKSAAGQALGERALLVEQSTRRLARPDGLRPSAQALQMTTPADGSSSGTEGNGANAQVSFGDTPWCLRYELSGVCMGFAIIVVERSVVIVFAARAVRGGPAADWTS
jgi:hypothetical protein